VAHPRRGGNALFTYIDGWYNTHRIQKRLGDLSPADHEAAWRTSNSNQRQQDTVEPASATAR
jgi:transposase InsO family protein